MSTGIVEWTDDGNRRYRERDGSGKRLGKSAHAPLWPIPIGRELPLDFRRSLFFVRWITQQASIEQVLRRVASMEECAILRGLAMIFAGSVKPAAFLHSKQEALNHGQSQLNRKERLWSSFVFEMGRKFRMQ